MAPLTRLYQIFIYPWQFLGWLALYPIFLIYCLLKPFFHARNNPVSICFILHFQWDNLVPFIGDLLNKGFIVKVIMNPRVHGQYLQFQNIWENYWFEKCQDHPEVQIKAPSITNNWFWWDCRHIFFDDEHYIPFLLTPKSWPSKKYRTWNVWHAAGYFKQFGVNRKNPSVLSKLKYSLNFPNSPHWDWFCVSSSACRPIYSQSENMPITNVIDVGYPRCDWFIQKQSRDFLKTISFGNLSSYNILLYAPTFRERMSAKAQILHIFQALPLKELQQQFPHFYILIQLHPHLIDILYTNESLYSLLPQQSNWGIFQQEYPSIALLERCSLLVTDYSSIFIDYLLLDKPFFFYPFDYSRYVQEQREFYFSYHDFLNPYIANNKSEFLKLVQATQYRGWSGHRAQQLKELFFSYPHNSFIEQWIGWIDQNP